MTTTIRTALLSALILSLTCGFAVASDLPTGTRAATSQAQGGIRQPLTVKCKDPIECNRGRA